MNTDTPITDKTKYAYSFDEEHFTGHFDSPEHAAMEAFASDERDVCYVGECDTPIPEDYLDGGDLIEHIACQDAFCNDWAEGWPDNTKEQLDELTTGLRALFAAWLDKHDLRPEFFTVENVKTIKRHEQP